MLAAPVQLVKHPMTDCSIVSSISFDARRTETGLRLQYAVLGDIGQIKRPGNPGGQRRDELWQTTCFELFARDPDATAYCEFNFAPNGDWAAYRFTGYRADMTHSDQAQPTIREQIEDDRLSLQVDVPLSFTDLNADKIAVGPAVIIETLEGVRSYWALYHQADRPDFHLAQNFQISLD